MLVVTIGHVCPTNFPPIQIRFSFMTVYCLHLAQLLLSKLVPFWSVRRHHSTFKWWMCNCSHHLILVVSMPLMAHDLCAGKDPCCMAYDESLMKSHLEQCYESEKLSHFPRARRSCSRRIYKDVQVAVYCTDLPLSGCTYIRKIWAHGRVWYLQAVVSPNLPEHSWPSFQENKIS